MSRQASPQRTVKRPGVDRGSVRRNDRRTPPKAFQLQPRFRGNVQRSSSKTRTSESSAPLRTDMFGTSMGLCLLHNT